MIPYVFYMLLPAFLLTAGLTRAWIRIAQQNQILDLPNARGAHSKATPRGGGVAILMVTLVVVSVHYVALGFASDPLFMALVWGGLGIGMLGLVDDLYSLRARHRFVIQLLIAMLAVYWLPELPELPGIDSFEWPSWLAFGCAVFAVVWSVNLFNFMDGINGLAGMEAISVSMGGALILMLSEQYTELGIMFTVAGSVSGFLIFNFPKASVFMGDSGSCFLGYMIAIMALGTSGIDTVSPWSWVILYGVFVVDTSLTLLARMLTGQRWYEPHNLHAYQKLARSLGSHVRVTALIFLINGLWCLPLAVLATLYSDHSFWIVVIALAPITIGLLSLRPGRAS